MRVLHLFDASDVSLPHARLALLAQSIGRLSDVQEDLCLLGNGELETAATELGLFARWRFNVAGKHALAGYFTARSALRHESYDLIHCWSAGAMGAATLAMLVAPRTPRVVTITQPCSKRQAHWARMFCSEAPSRTTYLPISNTLARELKESGVNPQAVHVLRPGIDMSLVSAQNRQPVRAALGATAQTLVVGLISDPPEVVNCVNAHMAAGLADQILRSKGVPVMLVVHPQQMNIDQSMAAGRALDMKETLRIDPRVACPWELLPGCDVALAMENTGGGLPLLWAMAANVPIIGEANHAISEIVEDRHSALLAKPGIPKALTHRLVQIATDKQLAWKLKDTARHEAYSLFSRQTYVQSLQQVYQQIVTGQEVQVPELQSTGGMRFAGRA